MPFLYYLCALVHHLHPHPHVVHYIQEISVHSYFLNIIICICQKSSVARQPLAGEVGEKVTLSDFPAFLGVEQNTIE